MKTNFTWEIHEIVFRALETISSDMWERQQREDVDNVEETNVYGEAYVRCGFPSFKRGIFVCCNNYNGKVLTFIVLLRFRIHINCHPSFLPLPTSLNFIKFATQAKVSLNSREGVGGKLSSFLALHISGSVFGKVYCVSKTFIILLKL